MEPPRPPAVDVSRARTGYGRATAPWAGGGRLEVEDDWWMALSLAPYVDYNLALLHGPTAPDAAAHVLEEIDRARVPAVVMLAGAGLAAAGTLGDAGWVCTGCEPFMVRGDGPAHDDPAVRRLGPSDLAAARSLAAAAFGVDDEVSAVVYAERALDRPDTRLWGLVDGGGLRSCVLSVWVDDAYCVGWALATAPDRQRSGYGRRRMRATNFQRLHRGGPPVALLTASPAGEHLYLEEGYTTLEHWQTWSRPRWVLR